MNPGALSVRANTGAAAYAVAAVVSAAAFAAACVIGRTWLLLGAPAAALLLWLAPRVRDRAQTAALTAIGAACGVGVLVGLSPLLLIASLSAAVVVWDLAALNRRSRGASDPDAARGVERAHVRRLVVTVGGGGVLGAAAVLVRVRLGFAVLLALGIVLTIGLSLFLRTLRGSGEP